MLKHLDISGSHENLKRLLDDSRPLLAEVTCDDHLNLGFEVHITHTEGLEIHKFLIMGCCPSILDRVEAILTRNRNL